MSACYAINLDIYVKNEDNIIKKLTEKIAKDEASDHAHYQSSPSENTTLREMIGIFLASDARNYEFEERVEGKEHHVIASSFFNASYGWEIVLIEMFKAIVDDLKDGSGLIIDIENNYDKFIVKDGKVIQLH